MSRHTHTDTEDVPEADSFAAQEVPDDISHPLTMASLPRRAWSLILRSDFSSPYLRKQADGQFRSAYINAAEEFLSHTAALSSCLLQPRPPMPNADCNLRCTFESHRVYPRTGTPGTVFTRIQSGVARGVGVLLIIFFDEIGNTIFQLEFPQNLDGIS